MGYGKPSSMPRMADHMLFHRIRAARSKLGLFRNRILLLCSAGGSHPALTMAGVLGVRAVRR
jgi:hypothetical protein